MSDERFQHSHQSSNLQELIDWCRKGDQLAAKLLYERYVDRMLLCASRRLSQRFSSRVDAEDIIQSAFRSFFIRLQNGEYQFDKNEDIPRLLMRITLNKTLRHVAYHQAARRSTQNEIGQTELEKEVLIQVAGRDPTPDEAVMFVDQVDHFLQKLPHLSRQIIELRLQGFSEKEIAKKLQISDRKVRRINERIRELAKFENFSQGGATQDVVE